MQSLILVKISLLELFYFDIFFLQVIVCPRSVRREASRQRQRQRLCRRQRRRRRRQQHLRLSARLVCRHFGRVIYLKES